VLETGAIIARSAGLIRKELPGIHPGVEQGIPLQVRRLAVILT